MTSRMATPKDYPALDALYAAGLVAAKAVWPLPFATDAPPNWEDYLVPVSEDAQGIRFGYTTRLNPRDIPARLPAHPAIHLDEEDLIFIGPRAGLTPSQFTTANWEVIRAWVTDCKARGVNPATYTLYGIVPGTWSAGFKSTYTGLIAASIVNLVNGEWYLPGAWTLIFGTVAQWDSALTVKGVV